MLRVCGNLAAHKLFGIYITEENLSFDLSLQLLSIPSIIGRVKNCASN